MTKLLVERFLKPCRPYSTVNPTDRHMAWEQGPSRPSHVCPQYQLCVRSPELLSEIKGVATPKDLKAVKERLEQRIELEVEQEQEEMLAYGNSVRPIPFPTAPFRTQDMCCVWACRGSEKLLVPWMEGDRAKSRSSRKPATTSVRRAVMPDDRDAEGNTCRRRKCLSASTALASTSKSAIEYVSITLFPRGPRGIIADNLSIFSAHGAGLSASIQQRGVDGIEIYDERGGGKTTRLLRFCIR